MDTLSHHLFFSIPLMLLLTFVAITIEGCIVYLLYFLLTLPMRRNERARLFLDLLELGLKDGHTPERAIIDAASARDNSPGARFHLLAAHLENGSKFSDALASVPRLLPPQVRAMLAAGERIGDVGKVLPACRRLLRDGVSQTRGALNYLILFAFAITPFTLFVPAVLMVFVVPRFKEVFAGMIPGSQLPAFSVLILQNSRFIVWAQLIMIGFVWLLMIAYVGGPRFRRWTNRILPGVPDRITFLFPWRRKRMQRDFSAMLAVLLDAGVPEPDAILLAGESTANAVLQRRAAKVAERLKAGTSLPDALRDVDDTGELHWRLANALHSGRGFLRALTAWHEALDAKAFQQEQAAAQITTSALVLINGLIVAAIVLAVFLPLIALLNSITLW